MADSHALILGLFEREVAAATAAHALRELGLPRQRVSIVAQSHQVEGTLADASGASPGSEIEDSAAASRAGELSAYLIAAVAMVMPGIGPIVAAGPLAADMGEAAGHMAGGVARALEHAGMEADRADAWERRIADGAVLVGAHVDDDRPEVGELLRTHGAVDQAIVSWPGALV